MSWGIVAGAAISVVGGAVANNQAKKGAQGAANAQERAQQAAIEEQRRQYDQTRDDLSPYMDFGRGGLTGLQALMGGDYSGFLDSPDYQFALEQGIGNLDRSAASRGGLFGGGQTRDLSRYNQGLASQFLGNYRNSLFQQAGMGQNAAAGLGGLGAGVANSVGNAYTNIGNAQAGAANTIGANNAGLATGIAGIANNYVQGRASSYQKPSYNYDAFSPNGQYGTSTGGLGSGWGQGWGA